MCLSAAAASAQPAAKQPEPVPPSQRVPVPYPHPLITEILFAVPAGAAGDASQDSVRDATGDEFIELINPHNQPIQLRDYSITDSASNVRDNSGGRNRQIRPDDPRHAQLRFTFPKLELQPGEVVVVFSGHKTKPIGLVGDSVKASGRNSDFHGAYVFSMLTESRYSALNNERDCVVLRDPAGKPVQAVVWGKPDQGPPSGTPLIERAPEPSGSVQRASINGPFLDHGSFGRNRGIFSPGFFDNAPPEALPKDPDQPPSPEQSPKDPPTAPPNTPTREGSK